MVEEKEYLFSSWLVSLYGLLYLWQLNILSCHDTVWKWKSNFYLQQKGEREGKCSLYIPNTLYT